MSLETEFGAADGRSHAGIGDAVACATLRGVHLDCIHAGYRRRLSPETQIGGRKSQRTAALLASAHASRDTVAASQQAFCPCKITLLERFPHSGAAHPLAVDQETGGGLDAETAARAGGTEQGEITDAVLAEAKVVAY